MYMSDERLASLRTQRAYLEDAAGARDRARQAGAEALKAAQEAGEHGAEKIAAQAGAEASRIEALRQQAIRETAERIEAARALGVEVAKEHIDFVTIRRIAQHAATDVLSQRIAGGGLNWASVVPWFPTRDHLVARMLPGGVKNESEFAAFVAGVTEVHDAL